jgi:hypothetical protein
VSWAGGTRRIERNESQAYEVGKSDNAATSVRATHLASDVESFWMWTEHHKEFHAMVDRAIGHLIVTDGWENLLNRELRPCWL